MNNRLYVGNLSFDTTTETVRDAFAEAGQVVDVHVVTDRDTGRSRGFAFVTMATSQEAAAAIEQLHGTLLDGRPLRVDEAQERTDRGSSFGRSSTNGRPRADRNDR
jgi:RNA recognition motif-containing protein